MPQVIYNGNGASGQVPVDSNIYAATGGGTVNDGVNDTTKAPYEQTDSNGNPLGIVTGNLTLGGATFLYWNTKADGSGVIHGWPADTSFLFPAQATNLTLWAQWAITTGLPNNGVTTHYTFAYDSSLQASGLEPGRTKTLMGASEADYAIMSNPMTGWFPGVTPSGPSPIPVYVTRLTGGANNTGTIRLRPNTTDPNELRCLLIAEVTESFMHGQNKGWGFLPGVSNEESCGEALSLFLTQQFELSQGIAGPYTAFPGNNWLNSSLPVANSASTRFYSGDNAAPQGYDFGSRVDYVNSVLPFFGNGPGTGCSILFIYYLFHQLGFTIQQIIAAAPGYTNGVLNSIAPLRGVYQNLTGDAGDPFPYFAQLLANAFPPNLVSSVPDPIPDDPWPLGSLTFWGVKNTYGHDEAQDLLNKTGGLYTNGFSLALEGFSRRVLGSNTPSIPAVAFGGVTTQPDATPIYYESDNLLVPQRILFAYDVKFTNGSLGNFPASGETPAAVTSSMINVLGQNFPANTEFFFTAGADPYFTNVLPNVIPAQGSTPAQGNVPWLSEDLRVFTATPGQPGGQIPVPSPQYVAPPQNPVPAGAPPFVEHSVGGSFDTNGAYNYIQALLKYLNGGFSDPNKVDPFDVNNSILPGQLTAFTGDSSVTPTTTVNGQTYNNYSFALARVRLRGSSGPTTDPVKVFFRLWGTQTADTDWNPGYTYLSDDPTGLNPQYPKAPPDNHTIPFFATGSYPNTNDTANSRIVTIPANADTVWAYFGCFLDVNDPNVAPNGTPIWQAFPGGTHHCLVAEIAYKDAPIQNVNNVAETTENSDQLAQRNLQVTTSDNPGSPATHRVPQTFDVRPSVPTTATQGLLSYPDELMIVWGKTPVGSKASIYWPQVNASDVLALASRLYGTQVLSASDSHTIQCTTTDGVTYVPIPFGAGDSFAGLLTVDLPPTVVKGQEFNIVVRRIGTRRLKNAPQPVPQPVPPVPQIRSETKGTKLAVRAVNRDLITERYVVGSFQVKIPVETKETMLPAEETTLAILKARLEGISSTNRWYPVLLRYIGLLSARVNGLGGSASSIPASFGGYPGVVTGKGGERRAKPCAEYTGKVAGLIFDHFGDFEGFVLDTTHGEHIFLSREKAIKELADRAWRERLRITVRTECEETHRPISIIVREPPVPFGH